MLQYTLKIWMISFMERTSKLNKISSGPPSLLWKAWSFISEMQLLK